MTGAAKNNADSESGAYIWICEHLASHSSNSSSIKSPSLLTADFLSEIHRKPLFATGRGRIVDRPVFKLPQVPAPPKKQAFTLTYAKAEPSPPSAPRSRTEDVDYNDRSDDDDASLALADFSYQFARWASDNVPETTAPVDRQPPKREILLYDNTPEGRRKAVTLAIQHGYINANNDTHLNNLMQILADSKNAASKDDANAEKERDVSAGGVVLGEVNEDGEGGNVEAQHVKDKPVRSGRLKGKARKEAKKAGRK